MNKCGARDARLVATRHFERVDPLEVDERGVRDAHLVAPRHVERVDPLEVQERGVRDARLAAAAHVERVDPLEVHEVGVDEGVVATGCSCGDVRLRRVREALPPAAHLPRDARRRVRPRDNRDGRPKLRAHEPDHARLLRVEEAEDACAHAVRAVEHREDRRRVVAVLAVRRERDAAARVAALARTG